MLCGTGLHLDSGLPGAHCGAGVAKSRRRAAQQLLVRRGPDEARPPSRCSGWRPGWLLVKTSVSGRLTFPTVPVLLTIDSSLALRFAPMPVSSREA